MRGPRSLLVAFLVLSLSIAVCFGQDLQPKSFNNQNYDNQQPQENLKNDQTKPEPLEKDRSALTEIFGTVAKEVGKQLIGQLGPKQPLPGHGGGPNGLGGGGGGGIGELISTLIHKPPGPQGPYGEGPGPMREPPGGGPPRPREPFNEGGPGPREPFNEGGPRPREPFNEGGPGPGPRPREPHRPNREPGFEDRPRPPMGGGGGQGGGFLGSFGGGGGSHRPHRPHPPNERPNQGGLFGGGGPRPPPPPPQGGLISGGPLGPNGQSDLFQGSQNSGFNGGNQGYRPPTNEPPYVNPGYGYDSDRKPARDREPNQNNHNNANNHRDKEPSSGQYNREPLSGQQIQNQHGQNNNNNNQQNYNNNNNNNQPGRDKNKPNNDLNDTIILE